MATKDKRATGANMFAVDINGVPQWIKSYEGGYAASEVVTEKIAGDFLPKKHIANVKYEAIKMTIGVGGSKTLWDWAAESLARKYSRKDGALIACDFNGNEVSRLTFHHALITEIGLPACDAASKDAAFANVSFEPEKTRIAYSPGSAYKGTFKRAQTLWSPANFRLNAEGLNNAAARVNKIEALTVKQKVVENPIGEMRDYEKEPTTMEIPNLVVTFSESHADEFYKWHEDFVVAGNCHEGNEKDFSIEYLDHTRTKVLMTVELLRCGIFKLAADKMEAGTDNIRRCKAEMYVEEIKFKFGSDGLYNG